MSLLGSILSNLLLVLGCAFFAGGIRHKHQYFNVHGSAVNVGLLVISVMALLFPMMLEASHEVKGGGGYLLLGRGWIDAGRARGGRSVRAGERAGGVGGGAGARRAVVALVCVTARALRIRCSRRVR